MIIMAIYRINVIILLAHFKSGSLYCSLEHLAHTLLCYWWRMQFRQKLTPCEFALPLEANVSKKLQVQDKKKKMFLHEAQCFPDFAVKAQCLRGNYTIQLYCQFTLKFILRSQAAQLKKKEKTKNTYTHRARQQLHIQYKDEDISTATTKKQDILGS